jgi:HK97 family phage prohead protease
MKHALASAEAAGFEGYASVFDRVDRGRDMVMKGAFARSIRERGPRGIKLLWQHDPSEPVGLLDIVREDARGLYVRGRLLLDLKRAREAHALMRAGALDGLSIGYRTVLSDREARTGVRRLRDVDLWEVSLVTFPMQEAARIAAFKAATPLKASAPMDEGAIWAEALRSIGRARKALA